VFDPTEMTNCDTGLAQSCCAEYAACVKGTECVVCANNMTCLPDTLKALYDCEKTALSGGGCGAPCTHPMCDPFTNAGCHTKQGEICDQSNASLNGYECFDQPVSALLCWACTSHDGLGPYCAKGSTCLDGACAKFCCDDGDCGSDRCDGASAKWAGLCVKK